MRGIAITGNTFPFTITGNRTWSGFQTFQGTTGQSNPTAEFRAATSQTGNLLEFYNAVGTRVAYFDQAGNFSSTGAASYASTQVVQGSSGIGFSVKAFGAGNSSDLQQWQNSTGSVLLGITSAGALYGATGLGVSGTLNATQGVFTSSGQTKTVFLTDNGANGANLELSSTQGTSTAPNKYLRSLNGQFQIVNSAYGATIFALDDAGNVILGKLQIRDDGATADPGVAWLRNAGAGDLVVNPSGTGQLYLAWDVKNAVNVGGNALVNGILMVDQNNTNAGTKDILFGTGSTEGIGSKRTAGGNQNGIDFYTANTVRARIDNAGAFTAIGAVALNFGTNTDVLDSIGGVNVYVNTASGGSTGGRVSFVSNGPTGNDGVYFEYASPAAGNTASRINITAGGAAQLSTLNLYAASTVIGQNSVSGQGINIRGDNNTTDPGMPWIRSDGNNMMFNPHATGSVYLSWDVKNTVFFGANINVGGGTSTFAGNVTSSGVIYTTGSGYLQSAGTVYGHSSYPCVESNSGNNMHLEVYTNGGSQSTATNNVWGMTINFARAFNNIPAIGASCATSTVVESGSIGVGVKNPSTTSVSVYFQNFDPNTQTLSNASAVIAGTNS